MSSILLITVFTYEVPSASTVGESTLITSKLIDQDTFITVVIVWAAATTSSAARSVARAVGLEDVLQITGLKNGNGLDNLLDIILK
jgi:hypothetical protein